MKKQHSLELVKQKNGRTVPKEKRLNQPFKMVKLFNTTKGFKGNRKRITKPTVVLIQRAKP